MIEHINFMLNSKEQKEELEKLQELLENTGIEARIITKKVRDSEVSFLDIVYDDVVVQMKKKRNAGRPYKGHTGRYTCGEIREMQSYMTNKEIAELLHISERTFYRRLNDNKSASNDNEFV